MNEASGKYCTLVLHSATDTSSGSRQDENTHPAPAKPIPESVPANVTRYFETSSASFCTCGVHRHRHRRAICCAKSRRRKSSTVVRQNDVSIHPVKTCKGSLQLFAHRQLVGYGSRQVTRTEKASAHAANAFTLIVISRWKTLANHATNKTSVRM